MVQPVRVEFSGAVYHVMSRGNTGMNIFRNKRDRERFLEYVGKAVEMFEIKVHSYCLITTHYHRLIETPHGNLSQAIKWINVCYSVCFNRKRRRVGHLFQGRFNAVLVDADEYRKHLSRYIHLNLVRARMVADCKDDQMTGETGVALGPHFGGISGAGIVHKYNQIAKQIKTDRKLIRTG